MAKAAMTRMLPMMAAADSRPYTMHHARFSLSVIGSGGWPDIVFVFCQLKPIRE